MHSQQFPEIEFRKLDALVRDYCARYEKLRELYNVDCSVDAIANYAQSRTIPAETRQTLVQVLREQYNDLPTIPQVETSIECLASAQTVCVTTGHQLCLFGGPAYVIYKILSTIKLAQVLSNTAPGLQVVPVFWMAAEDHDKEEINHTVSNGKRLQWNTPQEGAVGRFQTDGLNDVFEEWIATIEQDELRASMRELWSNALKMSTWAQASRAWIHQCFGEWGLVIVDADDERLKRRFMGSIREELLHQHIHTSVTATNSKLVDLGYKPQVNPRETNLFYLSPQARVRIEKQKDAWMTVDGKQQWSWETLQSELELHPENFSPNVLMRPIYQETILPNVAYIGGPGELAYWLQLKNAFERFELKMPALVLRDAAIILNAAQVRRLNKLNLNAADLLSEKSQIIERMVGSKPDYSDEKDKLRQIYEELAERVGLIDSTLQSAVMAELQRVLTGMEQLQGKAWKASKMKEEQKLTSLERLWDEIYPNGSMQERTNNILPLACANNKVLMRTLLDAIQPPQSTLQIIEI